MTRGYSDKCNCLYCAGLRRNAEEDRQEEEREKAGME